MRTQGTGVGRGEGEGGRRRREGKGKGGGSGGGRHAAGERSKMEKVLKAEVARGGKRGRDGGEVRSHGEEVERHVGGKGKRKAAVESIDNITQAGDFDLDQGTVGEKKRFAHFVEDTAEATTAGRIAKEGTPGGGGGVSIEDRRIGAEEIRRIPRRKREKRQGEGVRVSKSEAVMAVVDGEADGGRKSE